MKKPLTATTFPETAMLLAAAVIDTNVRRNGCQTSPKAAGGKPFAHVRHA